MKTLVFEGAGMSNTGGNDVTNCRLRTRIQNNNGRIIYLEIGGHKTSKYTPKDYQRYNVLGYVDFCFYNDKEADAKSNYSPELTHITHLHYEYTQRNIIDLVNTNLNCSFDNMEIKDDGLYVHDTEKPLCCSAAA
jgi:hypothetical protein